ncbi:MAG: DUF3179 domain-containing protein [Gemmatimonadales bacterium]|nr:DUF3179 domain-containing protein [Gemmatimonadales bacterium]
MTIRRWHLWLALVVLTLLVLATIVIPMVLIQPFAPQTPGAVSMAFVLRRWSPSMALLGAAAALLAAMQLWRLSPRLLPRLGSAIPVLLLIAAAWFSQQKYFEWMFAPLPDARFERAAAADFVEPDAMVLASTIGGDAAAFPVSQIAYHHLVEDAIGGVPIVATY